MTIAAARHLSRISLAGMQIALLHAILASLALRPSLSTLPVHSLLWLYPAAFVLRRPLRRLRNAVPRLAADALGCGAALLALLLLHPGDILPGAIPDTGHAWWIALREGVLAPSFVSAGAGISAWILGGRLARTDPGFPQVLAHAQFGFFLLLLIFLVVFLAGKDTGAPAPAAIAFPILALTGLFFSRFRDAREEQREGAAGSLPSFAGVSAAVLVTTAALILLVHPAILDALLSLLIEAGRLVARAIAAAIRFLIALLPAPDTGRGISLPPHPGGHRSDDILVLRWMFLSDAAREVLRWFVSAGWVMLLLVALWRASSQMYGWLVRRWTGDTPPDVMDREGSLSAQLALLWQAFREGIHRLLRRYANRSGRTENWRTRTGEARRLYLRFLVWAARRGGPRRSSQTPCEHAQFLSQGQPAISEELACLARRFSEIRYGGRPAEREDLREMKRCWDAIRRNRGKRKGNEPVPGKEVAGHA